MKDSGNIRLKFKIGFGVFAFIISLLAIAMAFALSIGVLFDILLSSTFYLAFLLGPLLFMGLLCLLVMLFSRRRIKWSALVVGTILSAIGMFDLTVKSLSSSKPIPLIKFASSDTPSHTEMDHYSPPLSSDVLYDKEEAYFTRSDTLGYVPAKNRTTRTSATSNGQKIFEVQYTIDGSGLRVAPPYRKDDNARSLLFFGCSSTFGYGLSDHETFPYRVGMKTNGYYKIFNFAFNGYGTHHMVAALESNFVSSRVDVVPEHIFYVATPLHIEWMQNQKNWGMHDPMYTFNEKNQLTFNGHFDELPSERMKNFLFECRNNYDKLRLLSYTLQLLDPIENAYHKRYADKEQDLFLELIKRARIVAGKKYPNAKFHVIYWPMNLNTEKRIIQLLRQHGFDYYLIGDIIPNYHENFRSYCISYPADAHPNARANDLISDFIVKNIISKNEDHL